MPKITRRIEPHTSTQPNASDLVLKKMREEAIEDAAESLAAQVGIPYHDLHLFPADADDVRLIPEEDARRLRIASFQRSGNKVSVAVADPNDPAVSEYLQQFADRGAWQLSLSVVSLPSLKKVWAQYQAQKLLETIDSMEVRLQGSDLEQFDQDFSDLRKIGSSNVPTSEIIEIVLAGATKLRGSDIHVEPHENGARLRYRIDGILQDIGDLPLAVYRLLLSRIKMLGGMKVNVRDRAQDGHFFVTIGEARVDIRVSLIPGNYGENINMRLLNSGDVNVDLSSLGIYGRAFTVLQQSIEKPNGMILNTGPTGSGKTTTLYSIINKLNKPGIKIITIEDPIEYALPGIVQTEVSKNRDYTFASALRAIVRQDPDIVLVGEIRDDETADVSVSAALTGHLLLSTLHTNDAIGTIPRLLELGVKPSLIASCLNVIVAQRLVRILCDRCKEPYLPSQKTIAALQKLVALVPDNGETHKPTKIETLYRPKGCSYCTFTGYRGRKGIFEIVEMTQEIRDLINSMASAREIFTEARKHGYITMGEDGLIKVLEGLTTMEEVWAATGKDEALANIYAEFEEEVAETDSISTSDATATPQTP